MRRIEIGLVATAALLATPALAADDSDTAILASLGLTAAEGKTSLSEGGGAMEGAMLAMPLIALAADNLRLETKVGKFVIAGPNDSIDLSLASSLKARIDRVTNAASNIACVKTAGGEFKALAIDEAEVAAGSSGRPIVDYLTAVFGAFRSDTSFGSFDTGTPDHLLASAIASGSDRHFVPGEMTKVADIEKTRVGSSFDALEREQVAVTRRTAPCEKEVKDAVAKIDAFIAAVKDPGEKAGPSLLELAAKSEKLEDATYVLRIKIEKMGGTTISKSGILYQFGWPGAVRVRAGLIVSYRVSEPASGQITKSGLIICRRHKTDSIKDTYKNKDRRDQIEDFWKSQNNYTAVSTCETLPYGVVTG